MWQWHCRNRREKKVECGNGIAEIGGGIFFFPPISAMPLQHSTFFFFLRNDMCTQFLKYFYNKF